VNQEQVEYAVTFSLAMLAGSLSYFLSLDQPLSFAILLLVPVLFGFTAYVSRSGFRRASLLAFVSLIFAPLRPGMALFGAAVSIGNPLVSVFASGGSFKDFYGAVTVPMLLVAAVLAASSLAVFQERPGLVEPVENRTADFVAGQASSLVEEAGLVGNQAAVFTSVSERSSRSAVLRTQELVFNSTGQQLSFEERRSLSQDFQTARSNIPGEIATEVRNQTESATVSETIESSTRDLLDGRPELLAAGIGAVTYTIHPLIGILTALSAAVVRRLAPSEY